MPSNARLFHVLVAAVCLGGCSSRPQRTRPDPAPEAAIAQGVIAVGATTITISSISQGIDFRLVQSSKVVSLEAEVRQPAKQLVTSGRLGDNGEWFTGHNLTATVSIDGEWVFLFQRFHPPIEGRLIFRRELGEQGGWYTIPKQELPPDQVIQYGYGLIGAVNLKQGAVLSREALGVVGWDPHSPPLLTRPSVILAGSEVAAEEIPVKPSQLPSPSGK